MNQTDWTAVSKVWNHSWPSNWCCDRVIAFNMRRNLSVCSDYEQTTNTHRFSRDRPCIRSESLWQCSEENMSVSPSSSVHNCLSGCVLRLKSIILSLETRFFINLLLFSSVMFDLAEPLANQAICYVSAWLMHYGPEVHSNPVLVNLYLLSFLVALLQNRTLLLEIEAKRKQFLWSAICLWPDTHSSNM